MRILLDENVPHRLRHYLGNHDVRTARYQGLDGISNGLLLKAAEDGGFEVVVTADQGIEYQQNRTGLSVALVVINSNQEKVVVANADRILAAIHTVQPGGVLSVDLN